MHRARLKTYGPERRISSASAGVNPNCSAAGSRSPPVAARVACLAERLVTECRYGCRWPSRKPEPPSAEHVEAAAWLLTPPYLVAMLVLEATGCRVGELEAARIGDLDETRQAWLVRAAISKTRRPRWIHMPNDLFQVIVDRRAAPQDRDATTPLFPGVTSDRLRMAIRRACRDAGVPAFAPHSLRHPLHQLGP